MNQTDHFNTNHMIDSSIKRVITILISSALILFSAGCGTKSTVVLIPDVEGNVGKVVVSTEGGERVLAGANQSVQARGSKAPPSEIRVLTDEQINSTFAEALAAQPPPPVQFILYFMQNSNDLTGESQAIIPKIIKSIQERGSTDIVISGHTDTVGSMEYNYKLSLERAQLMHDILVANGASPAHITVTSHGEGNQLIKTEDNVTEPQNRRVEVVIK